MREFAKVSPQQWTSDLGRKIKSLGIEARLVSFYLLTNPSAHMSGVYYIPYLLMLMIQISSAVKFIVFLKYRRQTP